jgi:hypothetical protein
MLFDKVCGVAERELPWLVPILQRSRVFHFVGVPHEFLPKEIEPGVVKFLRKNFRMPFPCTAVEDDAGLVILEDAEVNQMGLDLERRFIDITRFSTPDHNFKTGLDPIQRRVIEDLREYDPILLCFGGIERLVNHTPSGYEVLGYLNRIITVFLNPPKGESRVFADEFLLEKSNIHDSHLRSALRNAMTAVEELMYKNTPNKFILEISPAKRNSKKGKRYKISRTHDRPIYTILTPGEIRKAMRTKEPTGTYAGRVIHERQSHPRTFHHERFVNMRNKTINIPAIWVGESDRVVGSRRFRVLINVDPDRTRDLHHQIKEPAPE